jgi:DNA replication and repair protein RecF
MFIKRLLINELRNLKEISINDLGQLNYFIGPNGSGKTSLLEAIAIASQGRSFRSHKVQTVINQDHSALQVFVECEAPHGQTHKLGIERDRKNQYSIRIDGASAYTLAELSTILPVVVLDASAFDLLDGPGSLRRQFIDWGVFHVEHGFYAEWKAFNRILLQRNALLKAQVADYSLYHSWDAALVDHAMNIERHRLAYLSAFQQQLAITLQAMNVDISPSIYYKNGWGLDRLDVLAGADYALQLDAGQLMQALQAQFPRDIRYQTTHIGPHRADMQLRIDANDVKDIYSRGQKKMLVSAMKLAQAQTLKHSDGGKLPILLLDDLPSELDDQHLASFLRFVGNETYQCFITAVDDRAYRINAHLKARMFHVERGKISPMTDVSRGTLAVGSPNNP